jgi:hypothetical protein
MPTNQEAADFAAEWIEAWNSHDLDRILSHYAEEVEFFSPFAARLLDAPGGLLRGREALRDYFTRGFDVYPDLRFELYGALAGASSIAIHYRSVADREAIEVVDLAPDGLIHRSAAHYDGEI